MSVRPVVAVALGTQFPDLVDKPLAWTLAVLPNGRSLAHSLVVASALALVLFWLARYVDATIQPGGPNTDTQEGTTDVGMASRLVTGFLVGYSSHLVADAISPLVRGEFASLAFLGWPILPPVQYNGPQNVVGHFATIEVTPFFVLQIGLVGVATLTWYADGCPGLDGRHRT